MKVRTLTSLIVTSFLTVGSVSSAAAEEARALLKNRSGEAVGTVALLETPNGVLIAFDARNLPPGRHAVHIHETGMCEIEGGFESAGDHFAPEPSAHGYLNPEGPHAGDLPNQVVGEDGTLRVQLLNTEVALSGGDGALLDADGAAVVVHAEPDDYESQPSGDTGDRVACGVIQRS